jgi:hypothetical protein
MPPNVPETTEKGEKPAEMRKKDSEANPPAPNDRFVKPDRVRIVFD